MKEKGINNSFLNMLRTDIINHVILKNNYKRYCEIGLQNAFQNFDKIIAEYKISVDPNPDAHATFQMTSDDFFKNCQHNCTDEIFSCFFLDGLHSAGQLEKDFYNCMNYLTPDGCAIIHDTNPAEESLTHFPRDKKGTWNGSAYKFAASLTCKKITVAEDHGCTVIFKRDVIKPEQTEYPTWDYFDKNRKELLNLISWDEFIKE